MHWTCAVINFQTKAIQYMDSMGGVGNMYFEVLRDYLVDEYKNKKDAEYDVSQWQLYVPPNVPRQLNGCDCGVFTYKFAECAAFDEPIDFEQADMPKIRLDMILNLME